MRAYPEGESVQEFLDRITLGEFHAAGLYLPEEREAVERSRALQKRFSELIANSAQRQSAVPPALLEQLRGANVPPNYRGGPFGFGGIGGAFGGLFR